MQPTRAMLEAALRVNNLPELQAFKALLGVRLDEAYERSAKRRDTIDVFRAQGAVEELEAVKDLIERSADLLEKMVRQ